MHCFNEPIIKKDDALLLIISNNCFYLTLKTLKTLKILIINK